VKQLVYRLAKYSGLFALCRWVTRKDVRILCYHGIWMGTGHFGNFLYMSPQKFSRRMQQLRQLGYPVVSLDEALDRRNRGTLADCSTVLTIDDGWYGSYLHMVPALEKFQYPATIYVTTYYSENEQVVTDVALQYMLEKTAATRIESTKSLPGLVTTMSLATVELREQAHAKLRTLCDQLETASDRNIFMHELANLLQIDYKEIADQKLFNLMNLTQVADTSKRGIDIQLHTHRHRISHLGESTLAQELKDNRARLEPLVDATLQHFCYPSGVYDKKVWPELAAQGVVSATTTEPGLVRSSTHHYALPRILDGQAVSDLEFEAEMSGFGEVKRRLKHFLANSKD
jgi:peptidoglycan/xylan/chitin deacetylase (PgdA/CDA1 family)